LRDIIQSSLSSFILLSPNPSFSNLLCSPPSSPRRLREFWVACRSQDKLRCVVPDGVPPGAANLGFRRLSYPRQLDRPSQTVRPARAGSFGELISDHRAIQRTRVFDRKKRQHRLYSGLDVFIIPWCLRCGFVTPLAQLKQNKTKHTYTTDLPPEISSIPRLSTTRWHRRTFIITDDVPSWTSHYNMRRSCSCVAAIGHLLTRIHKTHVELLCQMCVCAFVSTSLYDLRNLDHSVSHEPCNLLRHVCNLSLGFDYWYILPLLPRSDGRRTA
jgi:hypothetical protein